MRQLLKNPEEKGRHVVAKRPRHYESVKSADGIRIREIIERALISDWSPEEFIQRARAKSDVYNLWIDRVVASRPAIRLAAKRELARTLLAMYKDFKRRLTPRKLELYRRIAWPKNHPFSGHIDSCVPFCFVDRWREFLKPVRRRRRTRKPTRHPSEAPIRPTVRVRNPSVSAEANEQIQKQLDGLLESGSDALSYVTVTFDFISAGIDSAAAGFAASVGGMALTIASIYLGLASTAAGAVQEGYKAAQMWGFAWGLYRYGFEIVKAEHRSLVVTPEPMQAYILGTQTYAHHKSQGYCMGDKMEEAVRRGVHDAVAFMNRVMSDVGRGVRRQLDQYSGILTRAELQIAYEEHIYDARVAAWKYIDGKVGKRLKGKRRMI